MSPSRVETSLPDKPAAGFPKELEEDSKAAKVDSFDSSTVTTSEVVASLIKNGGCIIRNILNSTDLAAIERDVRPHILKDQPWAGEFFPPETRRVTGLIEKSKTFTETIVGNQLYQEVCDKLLTAVDESWIGQTKEISIAPPQINNTIVFSIGPGAKRQELHRDDMNFHTKAVELKSHEDYEIGRDCAVGLFVAGKKTTKENGATRFIPRSHLWKHSQAPNEELAFYAELEPGDGFIMLASCYHGGSANTTVDEERLVYSCLMIKGFYRQEENQFLANSLDSVKQYTSRIQKIIGYCVSMPWLGWVNFQDPRELLLNGGTEKGRLDTYSGGAPNY